jgi:hypothetical protein
MEENMAVLLPGANGQPLVEDRAVLDLIVARK